MSSSPKSELFLFEFLDEEYKDKELAKILDSVPGWLALPICDSSPTLREYCTEGFWFHKYKRDFPDEEIQPLTNGDSEKRRYMIRADTIDPNAWTVEKAKQASENHYFIVTPTGGAISPKALSVLLKYYGDGLMFHTKYRIAGTSDKIIEALKNAGINDETIADILKTSVSAMNYQDEPFNTILKEELAAAKAFEEKKIKSLYSIEKAQAAADLGKFISADTGNLIKLNQTYFDTIPGYLYSINYRIAGRPFQVRTALKNAGFDEKTIRTIIDKGITKNNYKSGGDYTSQYDEEILRGTHLSQPENEKIYGFISPNNQLIIFGINRNSNDDNDDDRNTSRGMQCTNLTKGQLADVLYRLGIPEPEGTIEGLSDDNKLPFLEKIMYNVNYDGDELDTWDASRIGYYYKYMSPRYNIGDLCDLVRQKLADMGHLRYSSRM